MFLLATVVRSLQGRENNAESGSGDSAGPPDNMVTTIYSIQHYFACLLVMTHVTSYFAINNYVDFTEENKLARLKM